MSSWTTITLELRGEEEYYHATDGGHVTDDAEQAAKEAFTSATIHFPKGYQHDEDGDPINYLTVHTGGGMSAAQIRRKLSHLGQYATRAVAVRSNDTSDTGTAMLFERDEENHERWSKTDDFEELQREHGCQKGYLAASKMHVEYGIPAVAHPERFYPR